MWIYGYEDYKKENKNGKYDRVIIFHMLRSNITITIKNDIVDVKQNIHCKNYYNENFENKESYKNVCEESYIENFIERFKDLLIDGTSLEEIIKNNNKELTLKKQKLIITKIEYAHDKITKEIKRRSDYNYQILLLDKVTPEVRRYLMDIFHLYDYPKGNNTIRFHIFSESQGVMQMDVSINQTGIREIREDCRITEDEHETILYFCRTYFKLLNNKTPIKEILKIDNGATIAYRPFIIPTLSENVESVKKLIKKIL